MSMFSNFMFFFFNIYVAMKSELLKSFQMQNPIARWHICEGSVNSIAFSRDGAYIATVGRDGMNVNLTL